MSSSLNSNQRMLKYQALIGTGGIGSGMFFALDGEHTLGREESRGGAILNQRDYCKLHIISHYVQVLLGPGFHSILIGNVGDDQAGQQMLKEIQAAGMDIRYVRTIPGQQTLFSICFVYPDGTGGNLTTTDSACNLVSPADIARANSEFAAYAGRGIALAAPEVPLEARRTLLEVATQYTFFRAGAFVSAEIRPALDMGLIGLLDLVSLNIDEGARLVGADPENCEPVVIVDRVTNRLSKDFPKLKFTLTAGKNGSWSWDGSTARHIPAFPTRVVSTAGAGDAFLAAMLAGTAAGLAFGESQELATLVAGVSITSPHTIAPGLNRESLLEFAQGQGISLSQPVSAFLQTG